MSKHENTNNPTLEMTGFERAAYLRKACEAFNPSDHKVYTGNRIRVSYSEKFNTLYCPMCKMGSTFWTRVFIMLQLNDNRASGPETPFDIPVQDAPPSEQFYDIRRKVVRPNSDASNAFKFLFVRSPYSFIFSAYVDRIIGPNIALWRLLGSKAIWHSRRTESTACGSDVTFREFIRYITYTLQSRRALDCHVAKFTACSPCATNYSYVGQMETFSTDSFYILSKLNQSRTLDIFKDRFHDLYADDAIVHSVYDVYNSKKDILKCISWPSALRRVWRKLQIRGIIGPTKFPLTDKEANGISQSAFVDIVKQTQKLAAISQSKLLKKESFHEAYSTIPDEDVDTIARVYHGEMTMFGYMPIDIELTRSLASLNTFKDILNLEKEISET